MTNTPHHMARMSDDSPRGYGVPCLRGHERTPENTMMRSDGYRECRECRRIRSRADAQTNATKRRGVITTADALTVDPETFWANTTRLDSGCWDWTGRMGADGYGACAVYARRSGTSAHRIAWALSGHELDPALHLDHLCRNRSCVNPDHLEPVTNAENNRRSLSPSALNKLKTHCKRGHEFTAENTYEYHGRRYCRTCRRVSSQGESS